MIDVEDFSKKILTGLMLFEVLMMSNDFLQCLLIMVALWNRADHYIFVLLFVLLSSSFFPRLISAAADWMSAILPHMVWP